VFLCELCAKVHRSLGSHISKVKSLRLDKWDPDQIEVGNNTGDDSEDVNDVANGQCQ